MTRGELYDFLRVHRLVVISTIKPASPQASVVGIAVTDDLDIIFDTSSNSRKYQNLRADPRAALVIGWDAEQCNMRASRISMATSLPPANGFSLRPFPMAANASRGRTSPMSVSAHKDQAQRFLG